MSLQLGFRHASVRHKGGNGSCVAAYDTARCTRRQPRNISSPHTRREQHFQQHQTLLAAVQPAAAAAAAAAEEYSVSYEWSWQQKGRSHLPEADSDFDEAHPWPAQPDLQAITTLLTAAASACEAEAAAADATDSTSGADEQAMTPTAASPPSGLPSQSWLQGLLTAAQPVLQQTGAAAACDVLQLLSRLDYTPSSRWMHDALEVVCRGVHDLSTQQLAGLAWSLSNLRYTPSQQHWQALLKAGQSRLEDFYGPDLALLVCGAGSILSSSNNSFDADRGGRQQQAAESTTSTSGTPLLDTPSSTSTSSSSSSDLSLPRGWADAVLAEVQYQVTEFPADLGAFDLARLASGLADLGMSPSTQLQDKLLKAVYMRTRTIEEKGAVDFALAKLDAKGKKSMHYDPRWTHEELKWLPRRERDKRRILKEGWYRTQWTGWRP